MNLIKSQDNSTDPIPGLITRIFRSVFTGPIFPKTDIERKRTVRKWLMLHMRPASVPAESLRFSLSWGLGGMSVVLVLLQFTTGALLKFVFEPSPMRAYASIQSLQTTIAFGQLVRNLHYWSANLLVLIIFLHMLRVFFTGAFHPPRQFNWIFGWAMFALVLLANFTGYLMPYDQLAFWAVTVSTGMLGYIPLIGKTLQAYFLGGTDVGPATLRIFFAIHTAVIPVFLIILMGFHFWRIRKAGGLVLPVKSKEAIAEKEKQLTAMPHLFVREISTALVLVAAVLALSVFFNAPLGEPANPGLSPNPTKAPWYFAGFQELLLHFQPTISVFFIPLILAVAILRLPYVNYEKNIQGVWFVSKKGRQMTLITLIFSVGLAVALILADEYFFKNINLTATMPAVFRQGVLPIVTAILCIGFYFLIKRYFKAKTTEMIQTLFVLMSGIFIVLTLVGTFFRGKDMALVLPF